MRYLVSAVFDRHFSRCRIGRHVNGKVIQIIVRYLFVYRIAGIKIVDVYVADTVIGHVVIHRRRVDEIRNFSGIIRGRVVVFVSVAGKRFVFHFTFVYMQNVIEINGHDHVVFAIGLRHQFHHTGYGIDEHIIFFQLVSEFKNMIIRPFVLMEFQSHRIVTPRVVSLENPIAVSGIEKPVAQSVDSANGSEHGDARRVILIVEVASEKIKRTIIDDEGIITFQNAEISISRVVRRHSRFPAVFFGVIGTDGIPTVVHTRFYLYV